MPKIKQTLMGKQKYQDSLDSKITKMFSDMGKKGGDTLKKRGKKYFKELGKKGAEKRWGKINK